MRARTLTVSLLAAVLVATPTTAALAHQSAAGKGVTKSAEAKAKAKTHGKSADAKAAKSAKSAKAEAKAAKAAAKAAKAKKNGSVVLGGSVVSVTAAVPAVAATDTTAATAAVAGTVTFVVHGGRFKDLRGETVTASVADTAKVTRDGEAVLTDLVAGDHVNVKWKRVDFSYTAPAEGVVTSTTPTVLTGEANRVAASPADAATETDAEVPAS